jgi:hypothetical protein
MRKPKSTKKLLARDAKRNIAAELLASAREMNLRTAGYVEPHIDVSTKEGLAKYGITPRMVAIAVLQSLARTQLELNAALRLLRDCKAALELTDQDFRNHGPLP